MRTDKIHLVPAILQEWSATVLNSSVNPNVQETYVGNLEVVRDYLNDVLERHERARQTFKPRRQKGRIA